MLTLNCTLPTHNVYKTIFSFFCTIYLPFSIQKGKRVVYIECRVARGKGSDKIYQTSARALLGDLRTVNPLPVASTSELSVVVRHPFRFDIFTLKIGKPFHTFLRIRRTQPNYNNITTMAF